MNPGSLGCGAGGGGGGGGGAGGIGTTGLTGAGVGGAGVPLMPPPTVTIGVPEGPVGTVPVDGGSPPPSPGSPVVTRRGRMIAPALSSGRATPDYASS